MSAQQPLGDLQHTLQIARQLNASQPFRIKLWDCILPVSGQYGLLPRLLFYLLLCFGVSVRSHDWLAAGALAATMTYSGTAAIHIIITSFLSRASVGDDIGPIRAILSTACIMAVPLFNWSTTLRRLQARPLVIYWDVLVVVAYLSSSLWNLRYDIPEGRSAVGPRSRYINCELDPGAPASLPQVLDPQWLAAHRCNNSCDSVGYIPFRSSDSAFAFAYLGTIPAWFAATPRLERLLDVWIIPVIVLQGYYTCLVGRSSPAQLRNQLFLTICCRDRGKSWARALQNFTAKYLAIVVYLISLSMLLISPPTSIINLVLRELHFRQAPWMLESESPTMLGQWSPWVSAGLALLGAVIVRYHDRWMEVLQASFSAFTLYLLRWTSENGARHSPDVPNAHQNTFYWSNVLRCISTLSVSIPSLNTRLSVMAFLGKVLSGARSYLLSPLCIIPYYLKNRLKGLQHYLLSPLHSIKRCLNDEWKDFVAWFQDPYCVEDTLLLTVPIDLEVLNPSLKRNGANIDGPREIVQDTRSGE